MPLVRTTDNNPEVAHEWMAGLSCLEINASEVTQLDWRDYISSDPMICHGTACITGTRVMVTVILDSLADGLSAKEIVAHYPSVSEEAVQASLLYAAELAKERILPLGA